MSILLDQCVPVKFLRYLRDWGYEATLMSEHIQVDAPDEDVIALAQRLDAALLTVDMDFSNILIYPPDQYAGIIVMRFRVQEESMLVNSLQTALNDLYRDGLRKVLVIVESDRYRIRTA